MKRFGSGLLVTAAFIGPGTVTTASMAGASFGYQLVWALLFSVITTFVLQEMASRLGLVTGKGLSENLQQAIASNWLRALSTILIILAIGVGNAAYQGGNLTGAAIGLQSAVGGSGPMWVMVLGALSAALLFSGKRGWIERTLMILVVAMSLVFLTTMLVATPDWQSMLEGLLDWQIPDGASLTVIALVGTTIVPYNLFLHASSRAADAPDTTHLPDTIRDNRMDAGLSISLGGLVTLAVMACAASAFFQSGTQMDAGNIAHQLEPLLGEFAEDFFAFGLFAAGLTSAITAPLAAAYALSGVMGWPIILNSLRFRAIWAIVLICGVAFASSGIKPLAIIMLAQATNGLLLPFVAVMLIWLVNQPGIMQTHRNGWLANCLGGVAVALVSALGLYKLFTLLF